MNDQQINIVRTFHAPIEKVWEAWTTPEGWYAWFGKPGHLKENSVEMDTKNDGRWKSTTVFDGGEASFTGSFVEVEKPTKLIMTWENPEDPQDPKVETVTVAFKNIGDHETEMNFTQSGNLPPEEYQVGLKNGWTGFFDALEKYLTNV